MTTNQKTFLRISSESQNYEFYETQTFMGKNKIFNQPVDSVWICLRVKLGQFSRKRTRETFSDTLSIDPFQAFVGRRLPCRPGFEKSLFPPWDSWFSSQTCAYQECWSSIKLGRPVTTLKREQEPQFEALNGPGTSCGARVPNRPELGWLKICVDINWCEFIHVYHACGPSEILSLI